jgi:hypothetical protein
MATAPEGGYRAIPQQPDVHEEHEAAPNHLSASLELGQETEEPEDVSVVLPAEEALDARVRWVYFMLGNAVLLPWNGTASLNVAVILG